MVSVRPLLGLFMLAWGSTATPVEPLKFTFPSLHGCSITHISNSTITVHLATENHTFVLELQRLATDLTANAVHTVAVGDRLINVDLSHHQWLPGRVIGEAGSHVRIHIDMSTADMCDGMHGMVHGLDGSFMVAQNDGKLYITEDLGVEGAGSCDTHANVASPIVDEMNMKARQRRATTVVRGCTVFLDADRSFYKQWQGDCADGLTAAQCEVVRWERVQVKMISALLNTDSIYRKQGSLELQLPLAGTYLSATDIIDVNGAASMSSSDAFGMYTTWLASNSRGSTVLQSDEVCLNHLFTHVDMLDDNGNSVIGKAAVQAMCRVDANNAGYTTTLDNKSPVEDSTVAIIMAHELGHNLGVVNHDGSTCTPADSLMSSNLQNIQLTTTLSDCAITSINVFIESLGFSTSNCLIDMPSNPCGANVDGALLCCIGNQLAQEGTVCRAADIEACIDVAVCNGEHTECPSGLQVEVAAGETCSIVQAAEDFTRPPSATFTIPPTASPLMALPPTCEDSVGWAFECSQLAGMCDVTMFTVDGVVITVKDACPSTCGLCPFSTCADRKGCSALSIGYCSGSNEYWSKNACPVRCDSCQTRAPISSPTPLPTRSPTVTVLPAICTQRTTALESFTEFAGFKFKEGSTSDYWYFVRDAEQCALLCESMLHCPSFVVRTGSKIYCIFDNITLGSDWDAELANSVTVANDAMVLYNRSVDCTTPFKCGDVTNYRFGFTAYPGVKYPGNIGSGLFSGTIEECAEACAADAACTSFQYKHNKDKCQLEPLDGQEARSMVGTLAETIDAKILQDKTRIITFWYKDVACAGEANGSEDSTASISIGGIVAICVVFAVFLIIGLVVYHVKRAKTSKVEPTPAFHAQIHANTEL